MDDQAFEQIRRSGTNFLVLLEAAASDLRVRLSGAESSQEVHAMAHGIVSCADVALSWGRFLEESEVCEEEAEADAPGEGCPACGALHDREETGG